MILSITLPITSKLIKSYEHISKLPLQSILVHEFAPTAIDVKDVSGGCGAMFNITVESPKFKVSYTELFLNFRSFCDQLIQIFCLFAEYTVLMIFSVEHCIFEWFLFLRFICLQGISLLNQHKMVTKALATEIKAMHGVNITTRISK